MADGLVRPRRTSVRNVVAYAQTLRARAAHQTRSDPWAKPYSPSDAAARKLSQRIGPENAIKELAKRAVSIDVDYKRDLAHAEQSRAHHVARLRALEVEERRRRESLSFGQRIDDALARLALVSAVGAAALDSDQITGRSHSDVLPSVDDPIARARTTARLAAECVEREFDQARRVVLEHISPDRDERLKEFVGSGGLTVEQISIADPSQGPPSRIRLRLWELGIGRRL